jgi:hypothetical protein
VLPVAGVGGPLVQSGLVFTGTDDGNLHRRLWDLAVRAARSGVLDALPFDDMCLLTSLLSERGALWERFLPLGTIRVPIRGRNLPDGPAAVNTAHAQLRAPGERGPATLKTWRLLRRLRCCPQRGTNIVAAVLTLETATRH